MTRTRQRVRVVRVGGSLAALCLAAASTVALAQHSSTAAFAGQTADTGNTVTSAASFCAVPDGSTQSVLNDTYVDEAVPNTARGGSASLRVASGSGAIAHAYLRFPPLNPPLPPHCTITSATLRLFATSSQGPGSIMVYRASTTWSSATNTWNTVPRPGPAGTGVDAAAGAAGWHEWNVTTLTKEISAGTNDGFLVKDTVETNPARATIYESLDSPTVANRPQLVLTWG
jgi:hypothetical protein